MCYYPYRRINLYLTLIYMHSKAVSAIRSICCHLNTLGNFCAKCESFTSKHVWRVYDTIHTLTLLSILPLTFEFKVIHRNARRCYHFRTIGSQLAKYSLTTIQADLCTVHLDLGFKSDLKPYLSSTYIMQSVFNT